MSKYYDATWMVMRLHTGHDHSIESSLQGPPSEIRDVLDLGRGQLRPFVHLGTAGVDDLEGNVGHSHMSDKAS